ncbi:MAG: SAM-dependent methyltransferase [Planctomycetes bacterium]|nr:SAM-dependent methyltransferase [Planctomycetota bacterium]
MQLLRDLIIEEINKKGKIPFAGFMQMALYHPKYGYYNSDKERVGRFGDFYTSPAVHTIFGELIAKQLEEMWRIMGKVSFTVVEMGAGRGWLCCDIVQCVMQEYPEFYDHFHYIIVEANPYAKEKQRALLMSVGIPDDKVSWHTYTSGGFSFGNIQGCFLSNEFVDALPVHRLKVKKGILKEVYVSYNGDDFYEIEDEVSSELLKRYHENCQIYLKEGQEYEVNLDVAEWLRHVSGKLQKGFLITIDYGDTVNGIHRSADGDGTLRCFYKHTVNKDYYKRLGEQDITADVEFTHLMTMGTLAGLEVTGFAKQSHFLIALGVLDKLNNMNNDVETILKVKNLFHPEGMGDIFKVLIQHKNVGNPSLTGLRPLSSITI